MFNFLFKSEDCTLQDYFFDQRKLRNFRIRGNGNCWDGQWHNHSSQGKKNVTFSFFFLMYFPSLREKLRLHTPYTFSPWEWMYHSSKLKEEKMPFPLEMMGFHPVFSFNRSIKKYIFKNHGKWKKSAGKNPYCIKQKIHASKVNVWSLTFNFLASSTVASTALTTASLTASTSSTASSTVSSTVSRLE